MRLRRWTLFLPVLLAFLPLRAYGQAQHIPTDAKEIHGATDTRVIATQTGKDISGLTSALAQMRVFSDPLNSVSFNLAEFLLGLGVTASLPPLLGESGTNSGPSAQSSTFTGWAMNAGVQTNAFNLLNIPVYCWDNQHIPQFFRVRIYENSRSGTLKADVLQPAPGLSMLASNDVLFYLGAQVSSTQPLWVEIFSDGRFAPYHLPLSPPPYASPPYTHDQYTTSASITAPTWVNTAAQLGTYVQYYNSAFVTKVIDPGIPYFGTVNFTAASFTGWMAQIGSPKGFNRAEIAIYPTDAALLPTQIRFQVRATNETGTLLGDSTVLLPTSLAAGAYRRVTVDFQTPILNAASTPLVLLIISDGHIGIRKLTSSAVYGSSVGKYATNGSLTAPNWALTSTAENDYVKLSNVDLSQIKVPQGFQVSPVAQAVQVTYAPTILLGSKTYGVVGNEKRVYFDNVLGMARRDYEYDVNADGSLGAQDDYSWYVTPTSGQVGTSSLTITASKDQQLLATKTVSLIVNSATITTPTTRKVLWIGDSISADGVIEAEVQRLATAGNLTLTTLGTKQSVSMPDSLGGTHTINHEGISGWKVPYFYNSDGTNYPSIPQSPFVFGAGQTFNLATYLTTNGYTMASGDWLIIALGTNDAFSYTTDAGVNAQWVVEKPQIDAIIANVQAAVPGLKIGLCVTIPPAYTQSGFGINYGVGQTQARFRRNAQIWANSIITTYDNSEASNVYVIGTHAVLDTFSNMQTVTRNINSTNSATETIIGNGVHPASSGKWQLALPIWARMRAIEP